MDRRGRLNGGASRTVGLLLAAGAGARLGGEPKAFADLGGSPLFVHSLRSMLACPLIGGVVLLVPDGYVDAARMSVELAPGNPVPIQVRGGGASRQESVRRGLEEIAEEAEVIVCHDAARPFAGQDLFEHVLVALHKSGADGAVPFVRSPDTVKRVRDGRVVETIPREELGLVQTPQAFVASALRSAHQRATAAKLEGTDDAMLLEAAGFSVVAVDGDPSNFKITTKEDLARAELELARRGRRIGSPT
jgi:2-C-methyl-D-erythritol 4-phosphate cytidylyltransferase